MPLLRVVLAVVQQPLILVETLEMVVLVLLVAITVIPLQTVEILATLVVVEVELEAMREAVLVEVTMQIQT